MGIFSIIKPIFWNKTLPTCLGCNKLKVREPRHIASPWNRHFSQPTFSPTETTFGELESPTCQVGAQRFEFRWTHDKEMFEPDQFKLVRYVS
jgi:hypothetical protein